MSNIWGNPKEAQHMGLESTALEEKDDQAYGAEIKCKSCVT